MWLPLSVVEWGQVKSARWGHLRGVVPESGALLPLAVGLRPWAHLCLMSHVSASSAIPGW